MNRSVEAWWRAVLAVVVLGLTALGSLLWSLGVITIDLRARVEPSSSPPMITEFPKAPFEQQPMANNEAPTSEYRVFKYTGPPIEVWIEIERNGNWEEALRLTGRDYKFNEPQSPTEKPEKALRVMRSRDGKWVLRTTAAREGGSVALVTYLNESRGSLQIQLKMLTYYPLDFSETVKGEVDLINHQLTLENPTTGWSSSSPPFPAVLTDELTLLTSEIKLREKDREFTRHIRLKVRPIRNVRSKK